MLMRSSLSGGIALFPTFLGQSVSLNTASLQISHLAFKKKKKKSQPEMFAVEMRFDVQTWHI